MADKLKKVLFVDFSNCTSLTDAALMAVINNCTTVEDVHFDGRNKITEAGFAAAAEQRPDCYILGGSLF